MDNRIVKINSNLQEPTTTIQKFDYDKRLQDVEHLDEIIGNSLLQSITTDNPVSDYLLLRLKLAMFYFVTIF